MLAIGPELRPYVIDLSTNSNCFLVNWSLKAAAIASISGPHTPLYTGAGRDSAVGYRAIFLKYFLNKI